jgi:hypothetical protein
MQGKARKGVGLLLVRLQQYAKGTDLAVPADFPDLQEVASARTWCFLCVLKTPSRQFQFDALAERERERERETEAI